MSPTTQKFAWKDRDTAARDLLQLVYHAPESISLHALELLQAIRSPAVVPDLLDIFRDEQRLNWERFYALRAVSYTPIDLYVPELKNYLWVDGTISDSSFQGDVLLFVGRHASNQVWLADYQKEVIDYLGSLPPDAQIKQLREYNFAYRGLEQLQFVLFDLALRLLEAHPELLDLETVQWLRYNDRRESTQKWLMKRSETLIYLCLTIDMNAEPEKLVYLLINWDDLRTQVFQACPSLIPEYDALKAPIEAVRTRHLPVDLMESSIWQELNDLYKQAAAGDEDAKSQLKSRTRPKDILDQAAAVHFLGKLSQNPDFLPTMLRLLKYSTHREWQSPGSMTHTPIVFEAGEALREHPSAQVWETLIDVYFKGIGVFMSDFMRDWIAYQTDRLSGLEVEYTGATWDVERRPWFRALVEREQQAE